MQELRKDPIVGRWVIIAHERSKRPDDFSHPEESKEIDKVCPFCEGNESLTSPEIYALRNPSSKPGEPGWLVRVVPHITPLLRIEGTLNRHGEGMYDTLHGIGAHEVIIETPSHLSSMDALTEEQIANVIRVYIKRIVDLEKDPRFKYVLLFKNHKIFSGIHANLHCRSQLMALPVNPNRVKEKLIGAKNYFEYKERCLFCDIIKEELSTGKRIVLENDHFVVMTPFASRFPFEMMILPKKHCPDFDRIDESQMSSLSTTLKKVLAQLKNALGDPPYNMIIHTAPFRRYKAKYWKTIEEDFHWHIEIIPRLIRVAGFEWGTGFYINPTPPEEAAEYLR